MRCWPGPCSRAGAIAPSTTPTPPGTPTSRRDIRCCWRRPGGSPGSRRPPPGASRSPARSGPRCCPGAGSAGCCRREAALALGLALAVNWLWARTGGAIQSEPLFLLLGQATILAAAPAAPAVVTGTLLAACLLTRHVAVGLALAVLIDLALRGRWRAAAIVAATAAVLVAPWLIWMARAADGGTQAGLLLRADCRGPRADRRVSSLFYVRRIPDQITGPFVEVATVFRRSGMIAVAADLWAATATAVIAFGWLRCPAAPAAAAGRAGPDGHAAGSGRLAVHRGRAVPDPAHPLLAGRGGRGAGHRDLDGDGSRRRWSWRRRCRTRRTRWPRARRGRRRRRIAISTRPAPGSPIGRTAPGRS